jgi:isopentenyl-diphosphate delta-isomerase
VKEVGWGISSEAARKLINTGVSALDVAGAGGTSWSQVEAHRIEDERAQRIAFEFREWGISTSDSILQVRSVDEKIPLIASGGIRNGIDAAKCIALGADLCGVAGRILKAASLSTQAVIEELSEIHTELRIAMFSTASKNLHDLKQNKISRLKG